MKPFPHNNFYLGNRSSINSVIYSFSVHCHCRMPEMKGFPMVECDKCKQWFNSICENISEEVLDAIVTSGIDWICDSCK